MFKCLQKLILKMLFAKSSAAYNFKHLLTNVSKEANSVDPDQTAPIGAV